MADQLISAGAGTFIGGQDASKIPDQIEDGYYAAGVNVIVKRAALQPRWGFHEREVTFDEGSLTDKYRQNHTYASLFKAGKFQAVAPFQIGLVPHLVFVIGGNIFLYNQETSNISYLPISDGSRINGRQPRVNWTAAGKYLILFDFPSYPVIIDGLTARRADPAKDEIPRSLMGVYNQNRLFVANGGNEFTGGDPVGNTLTPDAPITFVEVLTPSSPYFAQIFQLPTYDTNDAITAMSFLQMADTSTGIGPMLIATNKAIYSYLTQNPRAAWDQGQFGSVLTYNSGIVGPRAVCNVNSDTFFMSQDGQIRSLSMSRDEQGRWSKVPISLEVQNWLETIQPDLLKYSVIAYFNNNIFILANPYRVLATDFTTNKPIADYAFGGMVSLDLATMTKFGQASNPAWDGLWTGVRPMDMVVNNEQCFIIGKAGNSNTIYEVVPDKQYDVIKGKKRQIQSIVYTKEYDFEDPFMNKELQSLDMNFDNILGEFKLKVQYKPNHSPEEFFDWRTVAFDIPYCTERMPSEAFLYGFEPQTVRDFTIGSQIDENRCDPSFSEQYRTFRKLQLRLEITGRYWELHEFKIKAVPKMKAERDTVCTLRTPVAKPEDCESDWTTPEVDLCT